MDATPLIERILEDEGLTSDLDEPAAHLLISELTARAKKIAVAASDLPSAHRRVEALCQSARDVVRRVGQAGQAGETQEAILRRLMSRLVG